ncbi:MAG: hypothetical protein C4346_14370 [Chloroflexota bacterium]
MGGVRDRDRVEVAVHDDGGSGLTIADRDDNVWTAWILSYDRVIEALTRAPAGDELHDVEFFAAWAGDGDQLASQRHDLVPINRFGPPRE